MTRAAIASREACQSCRHFDNDPAGRERALNGLTSLSSGYASVFADDGLCNRHQRYRSADAWCADFLRADQDQTEAVNASV